LPTALSLQPTAKTAFFSTLLVPEVAADILMITQQH
jgi:hypothetical protein